MKPQTITEKILSAKSGSDARAGDTVVCDVDLVIGTDASLPMAIDYFEQMGGTRLFDPTRLLISLDHYAPPTSASTIAFHERIRRFVAKHGGDLFEVGDGISHQVAAERGRVLPGDLVVGADSHTVTCGAFGLVAIGVGSSDLAAAMLTGQLWLRVPESIKVTLTGACPPGVSAKDIGLALISEIGSDGANYQAIEFAGALDQLPIEDRMVLSNLTVEMGAKAGIVPADRVTRTYLATRTSAAIKPVHADAGARYVRELTLDVARLTPRIALPHAPDNVVPFAQAEGTPVQMVFIGTCTGGRVQDFHEVLAVLERTGGTIAPGVQLVLTPASREVHDGLRADGTLGKLQAMGGIVTTAGCGACCGTSGVIPGDHMNVISTANRNFRSRMGNATASIWLASPAACALAAATGRITDPRAIPVLA